MSNITIEEKIKEYREKFIPPNKYEYINDENFINGHSIEVFLIRALEQQRKEVIKEVREGIRKTQHESNTIPAIILYLNSLVEEL